MQKVFSQESLTAILVILFTLFISSQSQEPCSNTVLPIDAVQPEDIQLQSGIPVYFNLTLPKVPKTLLIKIQYTSLSCVFNSSTIIAVPQLFLGYHDCPTSSSHFRKNVNMTVVVEAGKAILQAIAIYPYEHQQEQRSTSSFVVGIMQNECPQIPALVLASSEDVIDFTGSRKVKSVSMFPSVKQFFVYSTVNENDTVSTDEHQNLSDSLVEEAMDQIIVARWNFANIIPRMLLQPLRVYAKKNDFPREDVQDPQTFSYNSHEFTISPVEKHTLYYFSVQYELNDEIQMTTDMTLQLQVFPGKQCMGGCGDLGACNFTDGTCSCPNGYWGDSCSIDGCVTFDPCTVKGGKGLKQCTSAQDWNCLNVTCDYPFFYKFDGTHCARFFPEEIVIYMTVGVCLLSIFLGFMGGSCVCAIRYHSKKRRHYHNIDR